MKGEENSRRGALTGLAVLLLAGCGSGSWFGPRVADGTVSGSLAWKEPALLPPGAVLVVRLEEVPRAGASPVLIAEQTMEGRERPAPLAFELRYRGDAISPEREYFVSAEVLLLERAMLATEKPLAVLTRGRASRGLQLQLVRSGRSADQ